MEITKTAGKRENELARLIFAATDLSSVQRLRQYLASHPDLWLALSEPLQSAIGNLISESHQIEYLVNRNCFSLCRPDGFSLYSF